MQAEHIKQLEEITKRIEFVEQQLAATLLLFEQLALIIEKQQDYLETLKQKMKTKHNLKITRGFIFAALILMLVLSIAPLALLFTQ